MRPDPLNLGSLMKRAMGNPQAWNLYSYVNNNPVNFTDPTGLDAIVTKEDDQVKVEVKAQVVADPNSKKQMKAAEAFKQKTEKYWNKQTVAGPAGETIKFDVKIDVVSPATQQPNKDTLTVVEGEGTPQVRMDPNAPDTGTIYTRDTSNNPTGMSGVAPHETGHLMGLPDLYPQGKPITQDTTSSGDIMYHAAPRNNANSAAYVLSPDNKNVILVIVPPTASPPTP